MDKQEKEMSVVAKLNIGDSISYRLRPAENPRDPLKLWHGVVEYVYDGRGNPNWYRVRLTDEGYEGIRELVLGFQIVEVVSNEVGG
jgi:hypothetical protein